MCLSEKIPSVGAKEREAILTGMGCFTIRTQITQQCFIALKQAEMKE